MDFGEGDALWEEWRDRREGGECRGEASGCELSVQIIWSGLIETLEKRTGLTLAR